MQEVLRCEFFRVRRAAVKSQIDLSTDSGSFTHLLCLHGAGSIRCGGENLTLQQGDSYFLPAALGKYTVCGDCEILLSELA